MTVAQTASGVTLLSAFAPTGFHWSQSLRTPPPVRAFLLSTVSSLTKTLLSFLVFRHMAWEVLTRATFALLNLYIEATDLKPSAYEALLFLRKWLLLPDL